MNSAVQIEETAETYLATGTESRSALRQVAAERLAAHRSKRAVVEGDTAQAQLAAQSAVRLQARREAAARLKMDRAQDAVGAVAASRVKDAVAARYLQSQSYREFLAVEAQRALEQAQAEAEVAARSAEAVVAAQRKLLEEIEQWNQPAEDATVLSLVNARPAAVVKPARARAARVAEVAFPVRLEVKLHEDLGLAPMEETTLMPARADFGAAEEMADLDEEIEFRRSPEFEDLVLEASPIHGNIIEFPRELVASRKVRPRLAEGPLMEEVLAEPQLRIFEVEAELIAAEPEVVAAPGAPEWQSLRLGAASVLARSSQLDASDYFDHWLEPVVQAAPVRRRLMSVGVDAAVLLGSFGGAVAIAMKLAGGTMRGTFESVPLPLLAGGVAGALVLFATIYRLLFFTLNEATPGMRAMRLAFCKFDETSPTRSAVRKRLFATVLAACPLGMGLLWAVLDTDGLGWHDRMSRMYLREY
jgi:hypothetical protein